MADDAYHMTDDVIRNRLSQYGIKHFTTPENVSHLPQAAVLIGLQVRDHQPYVLLTLRSQHLRNHPSTVSFPGGKRESEHETLQQTALREANEEVGLNENDVEILCSFPGILITPGIVTTAFVGLIDMCFRPLINQTEVSDLFWLPLKRFLSPDNHSSNIYTTDGDYNYIVHTFEDHVDGCLYRTYGFTAHFCIFTAVAVFHEDTCFRVIDKVPIDKNDVVQSISTLAEHYNRLYFKTVAKDNKL